MKNKDSSCRAKGRERGENFIQQRMGQGEIRALGGASKVSHAAGWARPAADFGGGAFRLLHLPSVIADGDYPAQRASSVRELNVVMERVSALHEDIVGLNGA